ncbi:MAG: leucyl aminopeptidase, partial [Parvularculaceae bacterium]|nr:leucyl aminopeptidase [Parvularculaceae bacterium]
RSIEFASDAGASRAAVVAIADEKDLAGVRAAIGDAAAERVAKAIKDSGFVAKAGATASFMTGAEGVSEIHLVGVRASGMTARDWEDFGGRAASLAQKSKAERVAVAATGAAANFVADAALGAALGQYEFVKYISGKKPKEGTLVFVTADSKAAETAWRSDRSAVARYANWTRDMQTEPANILHPEEFVRRTRAEAASLRGVRVSALGEADLERLGMGAHAGVGRGSDRPPYLLVVEYRGAGAGEAPLAFVGKGITFDSGGISIKPNDGMWEMKSDMTGAASSVATVMALAKMGAKVNAIGVAALAENMPGGAAIRPGDVLKTYSGKTIEIRSTDAEGRLVLADALAYVEEKYRPRMIVTIATLTGAAGRALGDEYAALFSRDDATARLVSDAGLESGEEVWRLPLHPNYDEAMKSDVADVKNGDKGDPGAGTAAAFVGYFIKPETPWAHLDIAGVDWRKEATPTQPKGASGFGVRLMTDIALRSEK